MKKVIIALCCVFATGTILNAQTAATAAATSSRQTVHTMQADKDPKPAASYTVEESKTAAPACCKKDGAKSKACCAGHGETNSSHASGKSCSDGAKATPASCSKSATHSCSHASDTKKAE